MSENSGVFRVEDIFWINISKRKKQYGVIGAVVEGNFCINDNVIIKKSNGHEIKTTVTGIDGWYSSKRINKDLSVAVLLSDITEGDVNQGDVIIK